MSDDVEALERELQREDAISARCADLLRESLTKRAELQRRIEDRLGDRARDRDRNLTPIVFQLVRWSRWKHFNLPACGVGPFTSTEDARAWGEAFDARHDDPDEWHAGEWYALLPPEPRLFVQPHGFKFFHAWRKTTRVIYDCPCGEQASRKRDEGPPPPAGCPGLHNKKTNTFEPIAQSPPAP